MPLFSSFSRQQGEAKAPRTRHVPRDSFGGRAKSSGEWGGESRMRTLSGGPGVEGDLARNQAKNGARSGSGRCACNRRHASKRVSASSIVGGSTLVPGAEARRRYLYLAYRPVTVRTDKLCVQPVCTWRLALVHSQRKTWGTYPSLSLPCPSLSAPYRASIYLWSGALVHLSWGISHQPAGDLQTQSMPGLVPEAAGLVWAEVKNSDKLLRSRYIDSRCPF